MWLVCLDLLEVSARYPGSKQSGQWSDEDNVNVLRCDTVIWKEFKFLENVLCFLVMRCEPLDMLWCDPALVAGLGATIMLLCVGEAVNCRLLHLEEVCSITWRVCVDPALLAWVNAVDSLLHVEDRWWPSKNGCEWFDALILQNVGTNEVASEM